MATLPDAPRAAPTTDPARAAAGTSGTARTADPDTLDPDHLGHPVLIGAAVVASVLVVVARFFVRSPLWLDESLSVNIARLPIGRIAGALRHDGHPPLYYVLLHGWISVFGDGDGAVRALSGLASLVALPLAWLAGRRVGGRRLAWMTLIVFALSPYGLRYGSETRMYELIMALVFAGYLLVSNALERPTPLRLIGVAAVCSALLWLHYWSMWLLVAVGVLLVADVVRSQRRGRTATRNAALACLAAMAAGGLTFLPWLSNLVYQSQHTGTPWAKPFRPATLLIQSLTDFAGGPYSEPQVLMLGLVVLLVLGLFGRGIDAWHVELDFRTRSEVRIPALVLITTVVIASAAGMATGMTFASRYASVFFPFFVILVAAGLDHFRGAVTRNVVIGSFLVLSLVGCFVVFRLDRTQAGVVADAIVAAHQRDALVVTCPDQLGPSVDRALRGRYEVVTYPRLGNPQFVDWVDYAERNARNRPPEIAQRILDHAGNRPIFVVSNNTYRTLEGQCSDLLTELAGHRPGLRRLVDANADDYYEPMALHLLPAPPATP